MSLSAQVADLFMQQTIRLIIAWKAHVRLMMLMMAVFHLGKKKKTFLKPCLCLGWQAGFGITGRMNLAIRSIHQFTTKVISLHFANSADP